MKKNIERLTGPRFLGSIRVFRTGYPVNRLTVNIPSSNVLQVRWKSPSVLLREFPCESVSEEILKINIYHFFSEQVSNVKF